jgi:hypothetical protein
VVAHCWKQTFGLDTCLNISASRVVRDSSATSITLTRLNETGSLTFQENKLLTTLNLPALVVSSSLRVIDNDALRSSSSPLLLSALLLFIQSNLVLTSVDLRSLRNVGSSLSVVDNAALTRLDLPVLQSIGAHFELMTNPALSWLSVPVLGNIQGYIYICSNSAKFALLPGPPISPPGGLKVSGALKGTAGCRLEQGTSACNLPFDICP